MAANLCANCCSNYTVGMSAICSTCINRNVILPKVIPKVDDTEPIVGYRVWKLEDGKLGSCHMSKYFWPFRQKMVQDDFDNMGIYAANDVKALTNGAGKATAWDPMSSIKEKGLFREYKADVAGSVYLWGEVKECKLGYRAQYAYPKQLWVPEETDPITILQLEENYGVPVTMRKEFKKYVSEIHYDTPHSHIMDVMNVLNVLNNSAATTAAIMGQGYTFASPSALTAASQALSNYSYQLGKDMMSIIDATDANQKQDALAKTDCKAITKAKSNKK